MKKLFSLLLALSLVLSLTACGATGQTEGQADASAEEDTEALEFTLGTSLTKDEESAADDGTVLMTETYDLPQLALCTADGEVVELDDSEQADICRTFNETMQAVADQMDADAQEGLESAKDSYATLSEDELPYWTNYADSLTAEFTYQTDGLLSVLCSGFTNRGGAHPQPYTCTWNYDLTTGEFITFDTLLGDENPLAESLNYAITSSINDAIDEQSLSDGYFEEYEDVVDAFTDNANFYFTESGMVLVFDVYTLAPYAAGTQTFDIPYGQFYYALSEHMQSLFGDLSQDTVIVSDYRTTQVLWSWFNMSMPPVASETPEFTTDDGVPYYRTALGNVNTMDALRALLCSHVSEELADEWLEGDHFMEKDGVLYVSMGERGSDITIASTEYSVQLDGESGELTQTVYRQDVDTSTGTWGLTGETDEYVYPFTLVNGHAVFTDFPCPF